MKKEVLLPSYAAEADRQRKPPAEQLKQLLKSLTYEQIDVQVGDFATEPPDPVATEDGKLHFQILEGDVLLKVLPPESDCLLYQLRKNDDS